MITHGSAFVEPASETGWSKSVTLRWQVNCYHDQSEHMVAGANRPASEGSWIKHPPSL